MGPTDLDERSYDAQPSSGYTPPNTAKAGWSVGKTMAMLAILAMCSIWVLAASQTWPFNQGATPPDRLDDRAFTEQAEVTCAATVATIGELTQGFNEPDAASRAGTINLATDELRGMVAQLRADAPAGEEGVVVNAWLDDWEIFLADRDDYSTALLTDPGANLLVTAVEGGHVTTRISQFARTNSMLSCGDPEDVG